MTTELLVILPAYLPLLQLQVADTCSISFGTHTLLDKSSGVLKIQVHLPRLTPNR